MSVGPPCGSNPHHQMTDGDRAVVEEFKTYLAARAEERREQQAMTFEVEQSGADASGWDPDDPGGDVEEYERNAGA
ncbi:hypothetical protein ACOKM3_14205 [Streptomyces sp. BH106]|uniref:hypothetical protein n=1 Tax=Streptomyces sp. BH106 TaxID=3410409 RepID=UPI003CEE9851